MVHYDAQVMDGNVNAFQESQEAASSAPPGGAAAFKAYKKGEDVLIDCLLLAKCDALLKCTSAVGEFAAYFNPRLVVTDMNVKLRAEPPPPPAAARAVNPTEKGKIAFDNTHGCVLWPWTALLASRWLPRWLVIRAWAFCAVTLRLGIRHVAA